MTTTTTAPNVLTSEMQTKLSSDGANNFVDAYYHTLNSNAKNISQFYVDSNPKYTAATVTSQIVVNGAAITSPAAYVDLVKAQGADIRYDVEAFDTHVINPNFAIAAPDNMQPKSSIMVQVTGKVSFGKGRDLTKKAFSEVFVLVPNWESFGRNAPKNVRRFLVLSQNYRSLMD